jgi:hypothetical protein
MLVKCKSSFTEESKSDKLTLMELKRLLKVPVFWCIANSPESNASPSRVICSVCDEEVWQHIANTL